MKLPNGKHAIFDIQKLQEYCLSSLHPCGRHKARVFAFAGIRPADAEELKTALLAAAVYGEARSGVASPYGQRYVIDFEFARGSRNEDSQCLDRANRRGAAPTDELLCTNEKEGLLCRRLRSIPWWRC